MLARIALELGKIKRDGEVSGLNPSDKTKAPEPWPGQKRKTGPPRQKSLNRGRSSYGYPAMLGGFLPKKDYGSLAFQPEAVVQHSFLAEDRNAIANQARCLSVAVLSLVKVLDKDVLANLRVLVQDCPNDV